jgi:hypothetical protein
MNPKIISAKGFARPAMTPVNAIASLPPGAPGLESGASRAARQAEPATDLPTEAAGGERSFWDRLWGKDGFSFGALLDVINPLQHIPVVSTIYRAASGDSIGPAPRIVGGALFGGVVGLIASAADAVVEGVTGKDTGSHVLAMLPEPEPESDTVPQWARNDDRHHRPLMTAVMNLPDAPTTQFATDDTPQTPRNDSAAATAPPTTTTSSTASPPAAMPAAATPHAAVIPAAARTDSRLFAPPPRVAQAGAGGQVVPLASHGRPIVKLPTPQELAANPALLQGLRQGGAAAAPTQTNAAIHANTGRIDTAIKGHGLVLPDAKAKPLPTVMPAAFGVTSDTMPESPSESRDGAAPRPETETPVTTRRTTVTPAPRGADNIPEVSPDFLMKMQQALEKYQALRTAPTVDVSH